ncbi:MAG: hypothetical protein OEZ06_00840 [Myxococcales bacterium]|nr:hypothetical protein [Myxococcales bacterium]
MNDTLPIDCEQLERAAKVVAELPDVERLSAFAHDVVSRQAEGRTLIGGRQYIEARAGEHGLERAETPFGDLRTLLEQGGDSALCRAFVSALVVRGLAQRLRDDPEAKGEQLQRFVQHSDWLERSSPYQVLPWVPRLLPAELAAQVYDGLAEAVLDDDHEAGGVAERARNAGRIAALAAVLHETSGEGSGTGAEARAAADHDTTPDGETKAATEGEAGALQQAARSALGRLLDARDAFTRSLAQLALGDPAVLSGPPRPRTATLVGRAGRMPGGPVRSLLRWLTGWALLSALFRGAAWCIGLRTAVSLELGPRSLQVSRRTTLLGRLIREIEQVHPLSALRRARRAARYPVAHLVVGVSFLALGTLAGGVLFVDGLRASDTQLIVVAAGLIGGGALLDLALDLLISGRGRRVALDLDFGSDSRVRVVDVPIDEADELLRALQAALGPVKG